MRKKKSSNFYLKNEHIIFVVISVGAVYFKYGIEIAILYPAAMYAMFMTIIVTIEVYLLLKNKVNYRNESIARPRQIRLIVSILLIPISFWVIPFKMKVFAGIFATIILFIFLIVELFNVFRIRIINK